MLREVRNALQLKMLVVQVKFFLKNKYQKMDQVDLRVVQESQLPDVGILGQT